MKIYRSTLGGLALAAMLGACGGDTLPDTRLQAQTSAVAARTSALLASQPLATTSTTQCPLPGDGRMYASKDAAQLGFDRARLDAAIQFGTRLLSTSVRVYRHGCLAGQSALDPVAAFVPQPMFSGSKTILSLAVGRAITLGHLQLDDPIGQYLPEADAAHGAITVRQLLNQTSGLQLVAADEAAALAVDPVRYTLALPSWYQPGTEFMYAQNTLTTLSRVLERATGMDFQAFTQQELMGRIGIPRNHWVWLRDRSGSTFAWGGLLMRPDDEARIGHLMLNHGKWGTERVISQSYLQQAKTGTAANPGHGFLLWLNSGDHYKASLIGRPLLVEQPMLPGSPSDTYGAMGALGQMIIVVPSRDLVFVRNGGPGGGAETVEGKDYHELIRQVIAAVNDMPQNTDPGPYTYPAATSPLDATGLDISIADWRLLGTLLGVGAGMTPGCTLLLCNGRNLVDDASSLGVDAVQQLLAAVTDTTLDLAASLLPW